MSGRGPAACAALLALAAMGVAGCGAASPTSTTSTTTAMASRTSTASTGPSPRSSSLQPGRRRRARSPHRPPPPAGTLAQTDQLPPGHGRVLAGEMRTLWEAVRRDRPLRARPVFFPEAAYEQVKAIGDAGADWRYRLFSDFRLDIEAAHTLLGSGAGAAHLLHVAVPEAYAHWVVPGECENSVGYYEVPNARVVYREGGEVRSFGIASMISWRGTWYVVHLGYVGKLSIGGRVDDASLGPGVSVDEATC